MGKVVLKRVPAPLHDELQRRSAARGQSLRHYVLGVLRTEVEQPLMEEWLDEVRSRERVDLGGADIADAIRAGREEREEELLRRVGLVPRVDRLPRTRP